MDNLWPKCVGMAFGSGGGKLRATVLLCPVFEIEFVIGMV